MVWRPSSAMIKNQIVGHVRLTILTGCIDVPSRKPCDLDPSVRLWLDSPLESGDIDEPVNIPCSIKTLVLQRRGYRGQTVQFQVGLVTFCSLVASQDGCLGT